MAGDVNFGAAYMSRLHFKNANTNVRISKKGGELHTENIISTFREGQVISVF